MFIGLKNDAYSAEEIHKIAGISISTVNRKSILLKVVYHCYNR